MISQFAFDDEQWVLAANCFGHTSLFFAPDEAESRAERRAREAQAKAVCRECVVRTECLDRALEADERFGIWGGLTERERRAAKRGRNSAGYGSGSSGHLVRLPTVAASQHAWSGSDPTE